MRHDVAAKLERSAQDRRRERVIDDERHAVLVRDLRELRNVENRARGIRHRLAENALRVRTERRLNRLRVRIRIDERELNAELLERDREEIERAAVDLRGADDMVAGVADVENRKGRRRLSRRSQDRRHAPFERRDLLRHEIVRRICQPRVEIASRLQVKEIAHVLGRIVLERRRLINRNLPRLTALRLISTLHAQCVNLHISKSPLPFQSAAAHGAAAPVKSQ